MYSGIDNLLGLLYFPKASNAWNLDKASSFLHNLSHQAIIISSPFLQSISLSYNSSAAYNASPLSERNILDLVFQRQDQ